MLQIYKTTLTQTALHEVSHALNATMLTLQNSTLHILDAVKKEFHPKQIFEQIN